MLQRSSRYAVVIGICVAAAGFALDLLPGARPGLHSLQLLVILLGLCIVSLSIALTRLHRRKAWLNLRRTLARALIVTFLTLLALELVLVLIGYETYFPQDVPEEFLRPAPWWTCEDPACHYVQEEMASACENGMMTGRYCIVNAQGFHDTQDFVYRPALEDQTRILVLGDSFTFGEDADIGKSYVETLEASGPQRVVWNTGIFGVGTNQALAAFEMFAPVLKPHLTIYGFYVNDFFDNLFPVDGYFLGIDENGAVVKLQNYHLDPWGNVTKLETQSLLYYRWHGVEAPANEVERLLGSTRLGSIFVSAIDQLGKQLGFAQMSHFRRQVDLTRAYLGALRDASAAQDSTLLIMLIPKKTDLRAPGIEFRQAVNLFEELGISYTMPIEILDAESDYAPDWHWNNSGHQKVGALLDDCVDNFVTTGTLNDCSHVVLP